MKLILIIGLFFGLSIFWSCNNVENSGSNTTQTIDSSGWTPIKTTINTQVINKDTSKEESITTDSLEYLTSFIGKTPKSVKLWETQPLKSKLEKVLRTEFIVFKDFMINASPLKKDQVLYTYSITPDGPVKGLVYLIIDPKKNKIAVAIILGRVRSDFESKGEPVFIPIELQKQLKKVGF